jgi:hypothetical protein
MPSLILHRLCALRALVSALALIAYLLPNIGYALSPNAPLTNFPTETHAQQHCPADTVVWLYHPTGIYHFKRQRWYANTSSGAYVCRSEADGADMRATRNGQ